MSGVFKSVITAFQRQRQGRRVKSSRSPLAAWLVQGLPRLKRKLTIKVQPH